MEIYANILDFAVIDVSERAQGVCSACVYLHLVCVDLLANLMETQIICLSPFMFCILTHMYTLRPTKWHGALIYSLFGKSNLEQEPANGERPS